MARGITVTSDVKAKLKAYEVLKIKQLKNSINKNALAIERLAKRKAPVDKGRLRSSIRLLFKGELATRIGTDVVYAATQEFGDPGRNIPAQPYLFPAAEEIRPKFIREVSNILKKVK